MNEGIIRWKGEREKRSRFNNDRNGEQLQKCFRLAECEAQSRSIFLLDHPSQSRVKNHEFKSRLLCSLVLANSM
jgi:hypothetical protein